MLGRASTDPGRSRFRSRALNRARRCQSKRIGLGMELFRDANVDWMGKSKYFVALSLTLLAIGWISILRYGGMRYGIDFRGGTLVYVRFSRPPPIDKIRAGLQSAGLGNSTIQQISDISNAESKNDVVIGLEQRGQGDESLDAGKKAILAVLQKTLGAAARGKPALI